MIVRTYEIDETILKLSTRYICDMMGLFTGTKANIRCTLHISIFGDHTNVRIFARRSTSNPEVWSGQ